MNAMKPLSSAEAFLCCREAGEKEKESRGTTGSGTREETRKAPVFSLFPSLPARYLFFDYCYFYWDTQWGTSGALGDLGGEVGGSTQALDPE